MAESAPRPACRGPAKRVTGAFVRHLNEFEDGRAHLRQVRSALAPAEELLGRVLDLGRVVTELVPALANYDEARRATSVRDRHGWRCARGENCERVLALDGPHVAVLTGVDDLVAVRAALTPHVEAVVPARQPELSEAAARERGSARLRRSHAGDVEDPAGLLASCAPRHTGSRLPRGQHPAGSRARCRGAREARQRSERRLAVPYYPRASYWHVGRAAGPRRRPAGGAVRLPRCWPQLRTARGGGNRAGGPEQPFSVAPDARGEPPATERFSTSLTRSGVSRSSRRSLPPGGRDAGALARRHAASPPGCAGRSCRRGCTHAATTPRWALRRKGNVHRLAQGKRPEVLAPGNDHILPSTESPGNVGTAIRSLVAFGSRT